MTTDDRFSQQLEAWLRSDAEHRVPGHLADVLVQTAATRQRRWRASLERFLPMTATTVTGRTGVRSSVLVLVVLGALVLAALAAVAFVGSRPRTLPPPIVGLATNGRIVVAEGLTLVTYAPDGTDRATLATLPSEAGSVSISPEGARVAYPLHAAPVRVEILPLGGGRPVAIELPAGAEVSDEPVSWSADGQFVTFTGVDGGIQRVYVAASDGSSLTTPGLASFPRGLSIWQPAFSPRGDLIAFTGTVDATGDGGPASVFVMNADGTALRELPGVTAMVGNSSVPAVWSPDPAVRRLAYASSAGVRVYDLDTASDLPTALSFWQSWSPDGTRLSACCTSIVGVDDPMGVSTAPLQVFAAFPGGCPDAPDYTGRSVCSEVTWSPDGRQVIGEDIAGKGLVLTPSDGSGSPVAIPMPVSALHGYDWQPVGP